MSDRFAGNLMIGVGLVLIGFFIWAANHLNRENFGRTNQFGVMEFEDYNDYLRYQGRLIRLIFLGVLTFVPGLCLLFFGASTVFITIVKH